MFVFVVYFLALCLAPFARATASDQFKLILQEHASQCFLTCHNEVIDRVNLTGQEGNSVYAFGKNCALPGWQEMMSQCLIITCASPPDVAYAIEYASSICNRAGKNIVLQLPEEYLNSADGQYFKSDLFLAAAQRSGDSRSVTVNAGIIGTAIAVGAFGAALI